jgi:NAD(P)H-flavin reductase
MTRDNIYLPYLMVVDGVEDETLRLRFKEEVDAQGFSFKAGQFGEYSVFGAGECTFCIANPPTRNGHIECTFRKAGRVTKALRGLEVGDTMGFRGPYGNTFPIESWEGKDLLFIAGGIALPPMRCVIWNCLDLRDRYGAVTIVYGARSVGDLVYKRELAEWRGRSDVRLITTVDPGGETPDWDGQIGFVPAVLEKAAPASRNTIAVVCGPPIMLKFTFPVLDRLGFDRANVFTTLENRMKCGFGKCGRCNVGGIYVCADGPVFTAAQVAAMPLEY